MKTMKKTAFTFLALAFTTFAFSQTVDDGIKFIYYGKTKSAIGALEKVVAAKPKDAISIYWLGQAYLEDYQTGAAPDALGKAKALYQQALQNGVNDPWIWVGSGHVTVLEGGDLNAAKQQFEQAITSTKGKKGVENADILDAVGRAMADGGSKFGDAQYAVDKLKRAAEIDTKSADIEINLGIAYSKLGSEHGGDAVQAFTEATVRDPKNALAFYKIGNIYKGQDNKSSMDEWFGKAIAADQNFGPVYLSYFDYYSNRDVNAAKEYLDKYVALADKDCSTAYFQADYLFRAGKYQESLSAGQAMAAGDCKTYPKLNILFAYNYDRLGDSVKARDYLQQFFKASPDKIEPDFYVLAGGVYAKFPGFEDTASVYLHKAIEADTVKKNQVIYAKKAAEIMTKAGKLPQMIEWLTLRSKLEGDTKLPEFSFYTLTMAAINNIDTTKDSVTIRQQYAVADSITKAYIAAYPDKTQGYNSAVIAAKKADKDTTWGLAIEPIAVADTFLEKDTAARSKKLLFLNGYYELLYFMRYAKDTTRLEEYKRAIKLIDELLPYFPDPNSEENKYFTQTRTAIANAVDKFEKSKNAPAAKPAAGSKPNK